MPKQLTDIKKFVALTRRKDVNLVKIKKSRGVTKFKVRSSKYLYTLAVSEPNKVDKLRQSLPPTLTVVEI